MSDKISRTEILRSDLKSFTTARVALDKTGCSETTATSLAFKMAHAAAKDAVLNNMDSLKLTSFLADQQIEYLELQSAATDKSTYLQRPDLGRALSESSINLLKNTASTPIDLCIVVADGLSSKAVHEQFPKLILFLLQELKTAKISYDPICLTTLGRVAIADEIGHLLKAKATLILIGERPGLSSPDSLGAYITLNPKPGNTDESRNCISNIRPQGLSYELAAAKICYLLQAAFEKQYSGVALKDNFDPQQWLSERSQH